MLGGRHLGDLQVGRVPPLLMMSGDENTGYALGMLLFQVGNYSSFADRRSPTQNGDDYKPHCMSLGGL